MKKLTLVIVLFACYAGLHAQATKTTKQEKIEKIKETIKNLPDDLLATPEAGPDSNANKLVNDNLSLEINPLWKEKGVLTIFEYKLQKCDVEPLKSTFPLDDKKLVQVLTINMNTVKKSPAEKKQMVLADVQKHLTAFYKDAGKTVSKEEMATQLNAMVVGQESITTNQGKTGELYLIHDIQSQQAGFMVLLLIPGTVPNTTTDRKSTRLN